MNPISTTFVIVLLVTGLIVGLSIAGTDLLNFMTAGARAERIQADTNHQTTMDQKEEARKQAETEAYVRQQQILEDQQRQQAAADLAYQQQMNAIKLQFAATFAQPWMLTLLLILSFATLVIGLAGWKVRSGPARPVTWRESPIVQPSLPGASAWNNPDYRAQEIARARQIELKRHGSPVVQPFQPKPVSMSKAPATYNYLQRGSSTAGDD